MNGTSRVNYLPFFFLFFLFYHANHVGAISEPGIQVVVGGGWRWRGRGVERGEGILAFPSLLEWRKKGNLICFPNDELMIINWPLVAGSR